MLWCNMITGTFTFSVDGELSVSGTPQNQDPGNQRMYQGQVMRKTQFAKQLPFQHKRDLCARDSCIQRCFLDCKVSVLNWWFSLRGGYLFETADLLEEQAARVFWQLEKTAVGTKVLPANLVPQTVLCGLVTEFWCWKQQVWRKIVRLGMPCVSSKPILEFLALRQEHVSW